MAENKPHDGGDEGEAKRRRRPAEGPKCGRDNRHGKPCGQAAGWGTDHPGEGPCKLHGGLSTGPKTNEGKATVALNALKHGLFTERFLNPAEVAVYGELWEAIMEACDLDVPNQLILHRALMTFIKTHRRDTWEFEQATKMQREADLNHMLGMDGPGAQSVPAGNLLEALAEAKGGCDPEPFQAKSVPDLDKRFAKLMELLGLDRRFQIQRMTDDERLGKAIDAFGWLFGGGPKPA